MTRPSSFSQRLTTKFCNSLNLLLTLRFVATLFTSGQRQDYAIHRRGRSSRAVQVDRGSLPPSRLSNRTQPFRNMAGFYTEFELGLELDSVEVRGILLYNGQEWGRVIFDFLGIRLEWKTHGHHYILPYAMPRYPCLIYPPSSERFNARRSLV
ncbi:hypothetical protein FA13DRAFT_967888 [Coprinellus micaceus]|uniref:Uncharacterized protein n=1 Tax=Coprinellus micaceus TaxID=71717 RepID=A0A4Y7RVA7_COPMI|nr:hypothetical protein FA13DRAFT_967888 [Coprinellus micaceus]